MKPTNTGMKLYSKIKWWWHKIYEAVIFGSSNYKSGYGYKCDHKQCKAQLR